MGREQLYHTPCSKIKMYITINNIKGEKRIDLSYSIQNLTQARKSQLSEC